MREGHSDHYGCIDSLWTMASIYASFTIVQVVACRLVGAQQLPTPVMTSDTKNHRNICKWKLVRDSSFSIEGNALWNAICKIAEQKCTELIFFNLKFPLPLRVPIWMSRFFYVMLFKITVQKSVISQDISLTYVRSGDYHTIRINTKIFS